MLEVSELSCGYGNIVAAREISFSIGKGEILSLIGANGAGKSSMLMCLCGLVARHNGRIVVDDVDISRLAPELRIRHGIALVPEGRRVFADLSVVENLIIGAQIVDNDTLNTSREQIFNYFPILRDRQRQLAGSLSGGEQQMLAIGRALMSRPRILLVDELSLGLMPKVVDECYEVLRDLKDAGVAIVLVEQNTERAINVADHVLVIEAGNAIWQGSAGDVAENMGAIEGLLGA